MYMYGYNIVGQECIYSNYISMLFVVLYVIMFMLMPAMPCYIYFMLYCTLQVPNSISHVCCAIILNQCTVLMDQMQKLQQIVLFGIMYVKYLKSKVRPKSTWISYFVSTPSCRPVHSMLKNTSTPKWC